MHVESCYLTKWHTSTAFDEQSTKVACESCKIPKQSTSFQIRNNMKEEKYVVWSCSVVDMIGLLVIFVPCWAVAPDLGPWDSILLFWGQCAWLRWWASLRSCPRKQVLPSLVACQRRCIRKSGNTAPSIHWSPVRTASHFWLNPLLQTVSLTFCKTSDFVLFAAHLQVCMIYDLINLMWKLICACVADATYSVPKLVYT